MSLCSFSLITFQRAVIYPLLDLGLFHEVGSFLCEDELPETGPEAVPVVLDHWHAVLWTEEEKLSSRWMKRVFINAKSMTMQILP